MRDYLIASPPYVHYCGGIKILHKLCHLLNEKGYNAYITGGRVNPEWNEKDVNSLSQEKLRDLQHNGIIIYPDIVPYNPCKFTNVVRWWLAEVYPPGPNELIFRFRDSFQISHTTNNKLALNIIEDYFELPKEDSRKGVCSYSGKSGAMNNNFIPETGSFEKPNANCTVITNVFPNTRKALANLFQRSEVLYCYDNMSIISTEARLCGCPVIMVDYHVLPKEKFEEDEFGLYGIGMYHENPDIEKLKEELVLFRNQYDKVLAEEEEQLDVFIEKTQNWNKENKYVENLNPNDPLNEQHLIFNQKNFKLFKTR